MAGDGRGMSDQRGSEDRTTGADEEHGRPAAPAAPPQREVESKGPRDLLKVEPPIVPAKQSKAWRRIRHALQIIIPLLILWILWEEVSDLNFAELRSQLRSADVRLLALSAVSAVIAILATGLYDVLAFPHTPTQGATKRWGLGAIFFSWTNFVALGPVGVPFLRLHWYGKAGMATADVIRGVGRLYIGMTSGLAAWAIAALVPFPAEGALARSLLAIALAPLLAGAVYWIRGLVRRSDRAPTPMRTILLLGMVGGLDWGAVLMSFVFAGRAVGVVEPNAELMGVFFIGHIVGLVSMVPGGLGTADATWLIQLARAGVLTEMAAAHVMLFRLTFYVVPWLISLIVIAVSLALHRIVWRGK